MPRAPIDSIPPAPESASAWKAPGVKVEAWSPGDNEFDAKGGLVPAPATEPTGPIQQAQPLEPPKPQAEAPAPAATDQQPLPQAAQEAPPERHDPLPPAEVPGDLKDEQVTLEVGEEIPLEAVLPEGREIPRRRPMTGAERLMSLTLLDGTRLALPVRRLKKDGEEVETARRPRSAPPPMDATPEPRSSRPPTRVSQPPAEIKPEVTYTVRDLIAALRASAHGVDAADLLGHEPKWQAILSALVAVMVRHGVIDEQELIDEINKV
jgi:hypothetical protein